MRWDTPLSGRGLRVVKQRSEATALLRGREKSPAGWKKKEHGDKMGGGEQGTLRTAENQGLQVCPGKAGRWVSKARRHRLCRFVILSALLRLSQIHLKGLKGDRERFVTSDLPSQLIYYQCEWGHGYKTCSLNLQVMWRQKRELKRWMTSVLGSKTLTCSECVIKCYFIRTHEEEVEAGESVQINTATKA